MVSLDLLLHIQTLKERKKLTCAEGDRLSTQLCRSQALVTVFNPPCRVSTHLCADDFPGRCVSHLQGISQSSATSQRQHSCEVTVTEVRSLLTGWVTLTEF